MANSIKISTYDINDIKIGTSSVTAVYVGTNLVWSGDTPPTPTPKNYLRTIARDSGTISLVVGSSVSTSSLTSISYSLDSGSTWVTSANTDGAVVTLETPSLTSGDTVYWKGDGVQLATNTSTNTYTNFSATTFYDVEGNVMSLLAGDNFENAELASGYTYHLANLFRDDTKVINASGMTIPSMKMYDNCYQSMFRGCTSLTTAPELPATTLADSCYYMMFYGCTSLTTTPQLQATTLSEGCYGWMFRGCTSLTTAPELPATALQTRCYYYMFYGCSSLTTAPSTLPATILADYCYQRMFYNCTSLTTAPTLPATTLADSCYYMMFYSCSSLRAITCLATDISAANCTTSWLYGVAANGTFAKDSSMSSWSRGIKGIPSGWTVVDYSQ